MKVALLFTMLIAAAVSQYCPLCAPPDCTLTNTGFSTCSKCEYGALLNVSINPGSMDAGYGDLNIGVCQACPVGCNNSCHFEMVSASDMPDKYVIQCDQCEANFHYNYSSGGCVPKPANCLEAYCNAGNCSVVSCMTCETGYTNVFNQDTGELGVCYNTGGWVALEDQDEAGSSLGATVWIVVTTVALSIMAVLYVRERRKNAQPLLLNSASEKGVSF